MKRAAAPNFVLLGACGYIAARHMKAIKAVGGNLVAAMDPHDSAGKLDAYFPAVPFFTAFERLDRHVNHITTHGDKVDYVTVCSPNYLHDAHCRWALRCGASVICEKPLCINPHNVRALIDFELQQASGNINVIQQLRLHPEIVKLAQRVAAERGNDYQVNLRYITPRGPWYDTSWKGDPRKSGGLLMNLGVHFFDMLLFVFGEVRHASVWESGPRKVRGNLSLARANVDWELSNRFEDLPEDKSVLRSMTVDGVPVDFSSGFEDLHVESYRRILAGHGFICQDALPTIELIHTLQET